MMLDLNVFSSDAISLTHHQNDVAQNVAVLEDEIIDLAEAVEELLPEAWRRFRVCSRTCLIALLCLFRLFRRYSK